MALAAFKTIRAHLRGLGCILASQLHCVLLRHISCNHAGKSMGPLERAVARSPVSCGRRLRRIWAEWTLGEMCRGRRACPRAAESAHTAHR